MSSLLCTADPDEPRSLDDPRGRRPRPADGRARRHRREHRPARRRRPTSASPTASASGSSPPTPSPSAACCCSAAASPTSWGRKRTFIIGLIGFAIASALGGAAGTFELLVGGPRPAGRVRRAAGPDRARRADDHLHDPEGARPRVRRLRRDRRRRRRDRPAARRLPHRALRLALEPLHQRLHRRRRRSIGALIFVPLIARTGPRPKLDIPGTILVSGGLFGLVYGFSNAETDGWDSPLTWGMLAGAVDAARRVRALAAARRAPAAAAVDRARPQPRCRLPVGDDRRRGHVRHLPVRHLLPADSRSATRRSRPASRSCR